MSNPAERAVTLRLPEDLHNQLRERAEQEDRSMSQLLRVAARSYLQAAASNFTVPMA